MPRRFEWRLLLLVGLVFVAPGAAHANRESHRRFAVASGTHAFGAAPARAQLSSGAVRPGVDLEEARSENTGGSGRGLHVGTGLATFAQPSTAQWSHATDRVDAYRSSKHATVHLRAPPALLD